MAMMAGLSWGCRHGPGTEQPAAAAAGGEDRSTANRWVLLQKEHPGSTDGGGPASGAIRSRLRLSMDMGQAKHTEETELDGFTSDWESFLFRPRLKADVRLPGGVEFSGEAAGFFTAREGEDWEPSDFGAEDGNMRIAGWEVRALAGWGCDIEEFGRVSLLGGLAGRSLDLKRRSDSGESATTESDLMMWEFEGRLALPLARDLLDFPVTFEGSVSYGRLISPEAEVQGGGTIEGEGGWIFRARAGLDFEVNERLSIYAGGFYEFLKIEGGVEGASEWPDSESTAGGGELGVSLRF
jgi:hypothetical protein